MVVGDAVCQLNNPQPTLNNIQNTQIGDDPVNNILAGQWQRAGGQNLAVTMFIGVVHDNDHTADAGNKIHRATHALNQFARDHPIGQISVFRDFHSPKNGHRYFAAPDHAKALRAIKIGGLR